MRDALLQKKAAAEQWPMLYERMERRKAEFFQARQQREQMLRLKERAEAELERHKRGLALTHKRKALRAQAEIAYQQAQLQYQVATMRQTQLREALDAAVRREREGWRDAQDYQQYRTEVAARLAEEDAGVRQAWQNVRVLGRAAATRR